MIKLLNLLKEILDNFYSHILQYTKNITKNLELLDEKEFKTQYKEITDLIHQADSDGSINIDDNIQQILIDKLKQLDYNLERLIEILNNIQ